jgi:hypothetical protein
MKIVTVPGLRFAAAAGLTVLLLGTGTLAGHALWTAQASRSMSVGTATMSATATTPDTLNVDYTPGIPEVLPPALSHTVTVTVANTGTAPLTFIPTVSGGSAALNSLISVEIWKQSGSCTASTAVDTGTVTSGTLAVPPALNPTIALVPGKQSLPLCVRTTLAGPFPSVEQATSASLGFTGKVGTNWSTSTAPTPFTQSVSFSWFQIVQSATGKCLETAPASAAVGQALTRGDCSAPGTANQQSFRLAATDAGYYRLYPGTGTSSGAVLSGRPSALFGIIPSVVDLATQTSGSSTAALRQQWQPVPHGSNGDFQIKNRDANLCLTTPGTANGTTATITACSADTNPASTAYRNQHFQLKPVP